MRAAFELFAGPGEFELPRFVKGGWQIGEWHYDENPRFTVPGWMMRLVERWADLKMLSAGPMGPTGAALPGAGGYFDQIAWVMDAFKLFDRWAEQRKSHGDGG